MSMAESRSDMSIDLSVYEAVTPTTCLPDEELHDFRVVLPFVCLALVNAIVLCGNILVIAAVCTSAKLRSYVTNNFIASLAASDLLLGIFVLPFSATKEVLQGWVFGGVWCSVWLAVDVWLSTASILNLCAISLDRYIAISRPFKYHYLMSPRRSKMLIAFVWVFAFVICFPPLIGWNEDRKSMVQQDDEMKEFDGLTSYLHSQSNMSFLRAENSSADCTDGIQLSECGLTADPGYVIYSATGSFYLPMMVMLFFYWRIYRIAARTTKALKEGVLTTKAGGDLHQVAGEKAAVTLRVHRGGGGSMKMPNKRAIDNNVITRETSLHGKTHHVTTWKTVKNGGHYVNNVNSKQRPINSKWSRVKQAHTGGQLRTMANANINKSTGRVLRKNNLGPNNIYAEPPSVTEDSQHTLLVKISRKNVKSQLKRINKETKAAKTVAIIIGCFIMCWFPFFTVYLLGAFCSDCTPQSIFSVFFWLGYCNSAVNPFVYAYFSRDFRYAFKRLLCLHCSDAKYPQRRCFTPSGTGSFRIPMTSRYSDSDSDPKEPM